MGKDSAIEWTHHTFNPWWGCTKISPGCAHCYADASAQWRGFQVWGKDAPRRFLSQRYWEEPLAWNAAAKREEQRRRVFCASMADVFEARPELDLQRSRLWELIAATPWLDWLLLTKRPENIGAMVPWGASWPANVWLGTTIENAEYATKRIPELIKHPAAIRFLSAEPLLGPIALSPWFGEIDWVIVGGESGTAARPMQPPWARSLRDQCVQAGIPFFFKQWGTWGIAGAGALEPSFIAVPDAAGEEQVLVRLGKKKAGRELDEEMWDEVPIVGLRRSPPRDPEEQEAGDAAMSIEGKSTTANDPAGTLEPEQPRDGAAAAHHGSPRGPRVPSEALPPGITMCTVAIQDITIPPNRVPDPSVVRQLKASIADLGLLNPIILTPDGELVAGRNRVAAYVELGYSQIEAHIQTWSAIDRELVEIDENLVRRRLSVLERGRMLARRKELYEALHPEARQHARGGHAKAAAGATEIISPAAAFSTDAAAKLGTSERTVQEEIRIANDLAPEAAELILGTPLADEKVKLMALTRLPGDQQAAVARLLVEGRARSVKTAVAVFQRSASHTDTLDPKPKSRVGDARPGPSGAGRFPSQGEELVTPSAVPQGSIVPIDPARTRRLSVPRAEDLASTDDVETDDQELVSIPLALADVRDKLRRSKPGRMNADLVSTVREYLTQIDRELRLHEEAATG